VYVIHEAEVAEVACLDGTSVEVLASWIEQLDGRPSRPPTVVVYTHTDAETARVDLAPGEAGMTAEALALTDPGSWLGRALAEAAALLDHARESTKAADGEEGLAADLFRRLMAFCQQVKADHGAAAFKAALMAVDAALDGAVTEQQFAEALREIQRGRWREAAALLAFDGVEGAE
jgi:hypothetical protein